MLTKTKLDELFVYDQFKGTLSSKSDGAVLTPSRQVWVDGKRVSTTRVVYIMMTGAEPKHYVYFADGDKTNYKWENLCRNPKFKRRLSSEGKPARGYQTKFNSAGEAKHIAYAYVDNPNGSGKKRYNVGQFDTVEEATQAHSLVTAHNHPFVFTGIRKNADIVDGRILLLTPGV